MQIDDETPSGQRAAQLGYAITILAASPRRTFAIAAAYAWLWPPIRLSQILFLTDREGRPIGYATWAHVTQETLERLKADPPYLELSEWNEGDNLWIADFVAPEGRSRALARVLRSRLGSFSSASAHARGAGGRVTRIRAFAQARSRP